MIERANLQKRIRQAFDGPHPKWREAVEKLQHEIETDPDLRHALVETLAWQQMNQESDHLGISTRKCSKCSKTVPADLPHCLLCGSELEPNEEALQEMMWAPPYRMLGNLAAAPRVWHFVLYAGWFLFVLTVVLLYFLVLQ